MEKSESAIIIVRWWNKLLLLQRREDDRSHPGGVFCFPGGRVDEGETKLDAALREVGEETGMLLAKDALSKYPDPNMADVETERFVIAVFCTRLPDSARPPAITLSDEHQGCIWIDPTTLLSNYLPYAGPVTRGLMIKEGRRDEQEKTDLSGLG